MVDEASALRQALGLMLQALDLLDDVGAEPQIGAHLDLAIQILLEVVGDTPSQSAH
jgi:hypothetical protein